MLNAVNAASQSPGATTNLTFATNAAQEGTAITHTASSADIELTENGLYWITFSTTASAGGSASPPVTAEFRLQQDAADIPALAAENTLTAASDDASMSVTGIVNVTSAPSTITVQNVTDNIDYTNSSITVLKIT